MGSFETNVTRYVWASDRHAQILGSAQPPDGEYGLDSGTLFKLDQVDLATALRAFDMVLASPGSFSIVTRDHSKIDFLFRRGWTGLIDRVLGRLTERITLDIWFEDDPEPPLTDVHDVSVPVARGLIEAVFQDVPDADLWRYLALPQVAA